MNCLLKLTCMAAISMLGACRTEALVPLQKNYSIPLDFGQLSAKFCTSEPTPYRQQIKYVFIVDKSASNQEGIQVVPDDITSTDPSGSRRFAPLLQFVQGLPEDPNQLNSFALISFNDRVQSNTGFLNAGFPSLVKWEWQGSTGTPSAPQPDDSGYTNYVDALVGARAMIRADALHEKELAALTDAPALTSSYRIIFASDGSPVINSAGLLATQTPGEILPLVDQILALRKDKEIASQISEIVFNTAYYFGDKASDPAAMLLADMARRGGGRAMKFGTGQNILYGVLSPPVRTVKHQIVDVFVENRNAVWWDDGRLLMDTDTDGLPDELEARLGSDRTRIDADGNGVSDLVEYRRTGLACQGAGCDRSKRNAYSLCAGFLPTKLPNGDLSYPDSDGDGLNDCEEFLLRSDPTKFDSNGDYVPDWLAFRAGLPFVSGSSGIHASPQGDGLTQYTKLKLDLPTRVPRSKVASHQTRVTSLVKLASDPLTECYRFQVDQFGMLGSVNRVRIQLVENTTAIDDKPQIRSAERSFLPHQKTLSFIEDDFK